MSKIKESSYNDKNDSLDQPLLLDNLAMEETPLGFPQAFVASVELLLFLLATKNPNRLAIVYLLLLLLLPMLVQNVFLRQICLVTLAGLPTILTVLAVSFIAHVFITKRQPAFDSAHALLWELVQQGRAIRKDSYDVYLPSSEETKHGIIFFPGALIHPSAYASLATKLSNHGILVIVMSYGPTRLSMNVADCRERAQATMLEVLLETGTSVEHWTLAGHSLGGTLALNAAASMDSIHNIILCGVGRDAMKVQDISSKQVLVLNGSNDPFVNDCTQEQKEAFRNCLPPKATTFVTIPGGNHAGFAHYGPQTYPKQDGKRTISIEEQQEIFVQNTLELLNLYDD